MRRALAKYRTRELKLKAIADHFRSVFSQSEDAVAMPNPSSGLCWPLLPPAFLPEKTSLVTSIVVSLYTLCLHGQRVERLAAGHDPSTYPVVAASIFPETAGDLPSWKQLLSSMFKAMSETPDLRPTSGTVQATTRPASCRTVWLRGAPIHAQVIEPAGVVIGDLSGDVQQHDQPTYAIRHGHDAKRRLPSPSPNSKGNV